MEECPYCGTDLKGSLDRKTAGSSDAAPRATTPAELVACPDCDGVIDGFSPH